MGSSESTQLLKEIKDATSGDETFETDFFRNAVTGKDNKRLKEIYDKYGMRSAYEKEPIIRRKTKIGIKDSELKAYLTDLKTHLETDGDQKLSNFSIFKKLEECAEKWKFTKDVHEDMERSTDYTTFLYYNIRRQGDKYDLAVCYLSYGGDIENAFVLCAGLIKEGLLRKQPGVSDLNNCKFYLKFEE